MHMGGNKKIVNACQFPTTRWTGPQILSIHVWNFNRRRLFKVLWINQRISSVLPLFQRLQRSIARLAAIIYHRGSTSEQLLCTWPSKFPSCSNRWRLLQVNNGNVHTNTVKVNNGHMHIYTSASSCWCMQFMAFLASSFGMNNGAQVHFTGSWLLIASMNHSGAEVKLFVQIG